MQGRVPDLPPLDVDGNVISAASLIERVEELLATVDRLGRVPQAVDQDRAAPPVDGPIHAMRLIHRGMHPPEVGTGHGLRGSVAGTVKRLMRKLTSWYVEPRLELQQAFDAEAIEFASLMFNQVYNSLKRFDLEFDDLRRQNARLKLQLVDASERLSRYRHEVAELARRTDPSAEPPDGNGGQLGVRRGSGASAERP